MEPLPDPLPVPEKPFASLDAFRTAVAAAIAAAAGRGTRSMLWVDPDFTDWPIGAATVVDDLTRWARLPGRSLVVLGADFAGFERRHPRFVEFRRWFVHAVELRRAAEDDVASLPCRLLGDGLPTIHVADRARWLGETATSAPRRAMLREPIDALLQRSSATRPATTLGL